jgi:glutamate synthase (NADPH/NADH) large chain
MVLLEDIESGHHVSPSLGKDYKNYLTAFAYSLEDTGKIIKEMASSGKEPIGSMGNDVPVPVLSPSPSRLFGYFKQLFAQVTNPPIDPIGKSL